MKCDWCDDDAAFICIESPEHHDSLMLEGYRPDPWAVRVLCRKHTDFTFWPEVQPIPSPVRNEADLVLA